MVVKNPNIVETYDVGEDPDNAKHRLFEHLLYVNVEDGLARVRLAKTLKTVQKDCAA